ncbi:UV-damaged DNA-binding protein rad7 [Ascochyta rabiei]|uniref:UV-damaged DNA-binding protein rad7 n=1 Tax=Didymella rabiei TaxID=5454 RepID=UPI0019024633|nr:UV-damaged DNA-binding protein rad7 [Ascochyta rabiei]UPX16030.1 UV-damaged DNA-binding protein rad7 [Ascochyta rabiei]
MANRNKTRKNYHAYDPEEMERLRRVALPSRLKCSMCSKNFNTALFSEKQLADARWQISRSVPLSKISTKCVKCSGQRVVEIECVMCHETKGLEAFAKAQRKKPDDATCYACVDIQVKREAVNERRYEDPTLAFINTDSSSGVFPDYFTTASSIGDTASSSGDWEDTESTNGGRRKHEGGGIDLSDHFQHAVSLNGEVSETLIDSEFSYNPAKDSNSGTWSTGAGSWHTGSAAVLSTNSDFNRKRSGNPSTSSVPGSMRSFNSSIAERSQSSSEPIEVRNGFARVRAHKPVPQEDPFSDEEESSSDDDDNDDYSDGENTVV